MSVDISINVDHQSSEESVKHNGYEDGYINLSMGRRPSLSLDWILTRVDGAFDESQDQRPSTFVSIDIHRKMLVAGEEPSRLVSRCVGQRECQMLVMLIRAQHYSRERHPGGSASTESPRGIRTSRRRYVETISVLKAAEDAVDASPALTDCRHSL